MPEASHDFNNILGAILGYAELAMEDIPPESYAARDIEQITIAGKRARDLVKQILAFSRQMKVEAVPVQPSLIIKEILKSLRAMLPSTIRIQQNITPQAGPIIADPTQVHQVVMNLCTNAYHAMEEKGGTLSLDLRKISLSEEDLIKNPDVQAGDFVCLSVTDTGPGILPAIRNKIFDPYFTTKDTGKGTGMGLAITHGIVKSYGGFIRCISDLGTGSCFQIFIPAVELHAEQKSIRQILDDVDTQN